MASNNSLEAQPRTVLGKKVKQLRKQGLIPATVYGKGFPPVSISVDDRAFNTLYRRAGKTALIDLNIAGKKASVFVQDVQRHPISRAIIHADFKAVDLRTAIQIEVPVVAVGESPVVARGDALINHVLNTVLVEALPAELPQHIEVDVSILDDLDKSILVSDIPAGKGYKILTDGDQVLLSLTPTRATVEEDAAEETPAEPELIRRPREGDDEGNEE
ncbi:MAG: 50S ribosomal protein L25/general stress protein Ctc [Chloroflexi bacterium OHK40]